MKFKYHGNYCGPYWNQGKYQGSKKTDKNSVKPIDEFDETCLKHDDIYAVTNNEKILKAADYQFFYDNIGKGLKRSIAAIAVGSQGYLRPISFFSKKQMPPIKRKNIEDSSFPKKQMAKNKKTPMSKKVKTYDLNIKKTKKKYNKKKPKTMVGKSKRKYKKSNYKTKKRYNNKKTFSVINKVEMGGSRSDASQGAVYVGHGLAVQQIIYNIIKAIFHRVITEGKVHIKSWTDLIGNNDIITNATPQEFYYVGLSLNLGLTAQLNTPSGPLNFYYIEQYLDPSISWNTVAQTFADKFRQVIDTVPNPDQIIGGIEVANTAQLKNIKFFRGTSATNSEQIGIAISNLNVNDMFLDLECYSNLKIQNTTVGTSNITNDPDVDTTINLTRNPLHGKLYSAQNRNYIQLFWPNYQNNTGPILTCNNLYGFISFNSTSLTNTQELQKPPPGYYFNSKSRKVLVDPGNFLIDNFKYFKKMSVNQFFVKYWHQITNSNALGDSARIPKLNIGKLRFFGLEKYLDSRSNPEKAVNVSVDYEINQTYKVNCYVKRKSYTIPLVTNLQSALT